MSEQQPGDNSEGQQNPDPANLRGQLDASHAREREKDAELKQLKASNALFKANLGHLNEHQQTALINSLGDQEATTENLTAMATTLGFNAQQSAPQQQPSPQQQQQPAFVPPNPIDAQIDGVDVDQAIQGLTDQEYAHIMAIRGGGDVSGFEAALKAAIADNEANHYSSKRSKEAIREVIRNHGKQVGLYLESDLD